MPSKTLQWLEYNIEPSAAYKKKKNWHWEFLRNYVAVWVKELQSHYISWHFFWEGMPKRGQTLRLRFYTKEKALINKWMSEQYDDLNFTWWIGKHGDPKGRYNGEMQVWGADWPIALRQYQRGSELALELAMVGEKLNKPLEYHGERYTHLLLNQMGFDFFAEWHLHSEQAQALMVRLLSMIFRPNMNEDDEKENA